MRTVRTLASVAAMTLAGWAGTASAGVIGDVAPDGATYTLNYSNVGALYTFTFTADFTTLTGSSSVLGDYIQAISFGSVPGDVDWTAGGMSAAPYDVTKWSIHQDVVANSNGCPAAGSASKDWCIGLDTTTDLSGQSTVSSSSVLSWTWTMTLLSGTPDFDSAWAYKVVSTTGVVQDCPNGIKDRDDCWQYGGYQISEELGVPEPGTLALMGLGLLGLGLGARRRKV